VDKKFSREIWRIRDFAPNPLSSVGYLSQTLEIVDIDNDSIAETCFLYAYFPTVVMLGLQS
jgi:hypothetical protein